jgi:hypothetical protein
MDQMQREFYEYKVKTAFAGLTKEDLSEEYIQQKIQERRTSDKIRRERERQILEEIEKESRKKY